MANRKLSRESIRIGENLHQAILRAKAKDASLTNKSIAQAAGIHPVTISRITGGYGASHEVIRRVAYVIGADAERIITKGTRKPLYSVRTIEEILDNNVLLDQFVGGADPAALEWARKYFYYVFDVIRKRRAA